MNLLDLMTLEYRRSRRALYSALGASLLVYLLVLADALSEHRFSERLAIAAFVLQVGSVLLKHRTHRRYASAESIRRIAVLKDGLGIEPSERTKAEIAFRVGGGQAPKRIFLGNYFASERPPGVPRFVDDLAESAFWTHRLARSTAFALLVLVLAGIGASVFSLLALLNAFSSTANLKAGAEAVVVTLGFVVSGELATLLVEYYELSERAERTVADALAQLDSSRPDRDAALHLFGEYNCALAASAPLPTFLYAFLQNKLNAAWTARRSALPVQ